MATSLPWILRDERCGSMILTGTTEKDTSFVRGAANSIQLARMSSPCVQAMQSENEAAAGNS
jgi:hypothetical protein